MSILVGHGIGVKPAPKDLNVYIIHLVDDTGLVVDATDGGDKPIITYKKNIPDSNNQKWKYHVVSESDHTFTLESSSTTLKPSENKWAHATSDAVDGKIESSATKDTWKRVEGTTGGQFKIKCPDDAFYWQGGSDGKQITLQSSNGKNNQLWTFENA